MHVLYVDSEPFIWFAIKLVNSQFSSMSERFTLVL